MKEGNRARNLLMFLCMIVIFLTFSDSQNTTDAAEQGSDPYYKVITKGMDWGPGNAKIVIRLGQKTNEITKDTFNIEATKEYTLPLDENTGEVEQEIDTKEIDVTNAYTSDKDGERLNEESNYITLELEMHPDNEFTDPYDFNEETEKNTRVDIDYTITQNKEITTPGTENINNLELTSENLRETSAPQAEVFDHDVFNYNDNEFGNIKLNYASYQPEGPEDKQSLIVLLHGLGEGGTDSEIPLLGNKVTALASNSIQSYFGNDGAQVLVPQTDTMWMDDGTGENTTDGNNKYTDALLSLIKSYVKEHEATVDPDRIYVGGISNGGYMTVDMLLAAPDYFAAGFPIAQAYESSWLSDEELESIKDVPMWFTHAEADDTVPFEETAKPVVNRLQAMNAIDTKLIAYNHVNDTSGSVKDEEGKAYQYDGHWSWTYAYNDNVADEQGTSLFEWLAEQSK